MSICLLAGAATSRKSTPIATEDAFRRFWSPGARALRLRWVPLFASGVKLEADEISAVVAELERLKAWLSGKPERTAPAQVLSRVDLLLGELRRLKRRAGATAYIG